MSGSSDPGSTVTDVQVHEYASALLGRSREELNRADAKASLLLAASGVGLGVMLTAILSGDWTPFGIDNKFEWLWWSGIILAVTGVTCLGIAVFPRTRRSVAANAAPVAYFRDVAVNKKEDLEGLIRVTLGSPKVPILDQLYEVSRVVNVKYELIRVGLFCYGGALLACTGSTVLNTLFG
ncbi:Pycsar system effector family protein [Streptomyces mirabilis]|uniref:Pycsar system effector family protein n=1 Tax=Streptomyces mirabilis TaxID=68239 RepID=UPI00367F3384